MHGSAIIHTGVYGRTRLLWIVLYQVRMIDHIEVAYCLGFDPINEVLGNLIGIGGHTCVSLVCHKRFNGRTFVSVRRPSSTLQSSQNIVHEVL